MITPGYRFGSLLGSAGPDWDFERLHLEIDGRPRPDAVVAEQGNPTNRRFKARVPSDLFDGRAHELRIGGVDGPLTESISVDAAEMLGNRFDSHVVVAGGLRVEGWVHDAADPDRVVTLVAALDDDVFATFEPDEDRPPIAARYGGREMCGFALDIPDRLVSERTMRFTIRTDDGQLLRGFPRDLDIDVAIENCLLTLTRGRQRIDERCALHSVEPSP